MNKHKKDNKEEKKEEQAQEESIEQEEIKKAVEEDQADNKEGKATRKPTTEEKLVVMTDLLKRTTADFHNFRDRIAREATESAYYYKKNIITSLLPVLDMFELALKHKSEDNEFTKGMEMIFAQFISTLENEGLQIIKTEDKFNPELHEAILTEESDKVDNTILEELQRGYMLNNKVIRYARVKVSKSKEA